MLALSIHPWLLDQPYRIGRLERVLEHITSRADVWSASAGEIRAAASVDSNVGVTDSSRPISQAREASRGE